MAKRKHYPMAGLEMYGGSGLAEGILDSAALGPFRMSNEEAMSHGTAIAVGAATVALVSSALSFWTVPLKTDGTPDIATEVVDGQVVQVGMYAPQNFARIKNGIALAIAVIGGKLAYNENKVVGTAIVAGLGGLALAELIASFIPARAADADMPNAPYVTTQLHGYPAVQYN